MRIFINIYDVVCGIRGAEELFSIIERNHTTSLIFNETNGRKVFGLISRLSKNVFHIAWEKNNGFIVKRVHEILENLQLDLTQIKKKAMKHAIRNDDIEVIKYDLSMHGVQLNADLLSRAIGSSTVDVVIYLLNVYLYQSIPSHLHNNFIFFNIQNFIQSLKK